ncbi:MFS transporter [Jiangella alba]|uniref:Major Facilitator Superfamily protein n=1 Tax=Jiangella alba TaxID=561176 RepID=A0A1H5BXB0_9ACTN|nr:MFS transporter [Jiangella alba]SED59046.1 Major Facilitator Superfamily protein [Jiangella alba]
MPSALAHRPFRRLTVAWTFSNFGDSALYLTVAIWAKDLTGSNAAAGLVFLMLGLPVFLAPLAGQLADRLSRKRLVAVVNVVAAAGVLALLAVDDAADLWLIYLVTFGYGWVGYVTSAAQSGLLRDMLDDDDLAGANGLLTTLDQGLRLLTPLAGAGVYALYGGGAVAVLTASMLVIAALLVLTVRVDESPPAPADEREGFRRELTAGFRHLRDTPQLADLTLLLGVAVAITGLANSTTFAVVEALGMPSEFFGVLASVQGGGSIVGGLTVALLIGRTGERTAVGVGLAAVAAGLGAVLVASTVVVAAGAVVLGVGVVWAVVGMVTLRQRLTPARLQGRTSAATNMVLNGPQVAGTAAGAALISVVDYRVLVAAMAVTVLTCGIVLLARRVAAPVAVADEQPATETV